MTFLNTITNNILNIVFPINCVGCGQAGTYFCLKCLSSSPIAERESEEWIFPIFDYRHPPIKRALWLLKYKSKKGIAKVFAEIMHGKIIEELSELSVMENFYNPILIPIPLSKKRYRERGYNQAELLCKELVKIDNLRYSGDKSFELEKNILSKPKDTKHQAHIENKKERLKNIIGSFAIKDTKKNLIKNRNVILIDDILTTGATLNEAKKILKQAGAKKIIAFTVAH